MKTFRSMLLGTVAGGMCVLAAAPANAADVERSMTVSGWVNRMFTAVGDGNASYLNFTGNAYDNSRLRWEATATAGDITIGGVLGFGFNQNTATSQLSDGSTNGTTPVNIRKENIYFASKYGTLTLGLEDSSADGSARADLSGTDLVQKNEGVAHAGSYVFKIDNEAGNCEESGSITTTCGPTIDAVQDDMNGGSGAEKIMYFTPEMSGLTVGIDLTQGGEVGVGGYYGAEFGGTAVSAALGYNNAAGINVDGRTVVAASLSILTATGVNLTGAYGHTSQNDNTAGGRNAKNFYGKIGYTSSFNTLGATSFAFDYKTSLHVAAAGDKYKAFSVAAVQNLTDYGTEVYAYAKHHSLDRDAGAGANYDNIVAGGVGARVVF